MIIHALILAFAGKANLPVSTPNALEPVPVVSVGSPSCWEYLHEEHIYTSAGKCGKAVTTVMTARHGSVDLDDLIDRIDSALDGKRRPEKFDRCAEIMSCTALYCSGDEDCNTCTDRCGQQWRGGKRVNP